MISSPDGISLGATLNHPKKREHSYSQDVLSGSDL